MLLVTELLDDAQAAREELSVRLVRQQLDRDRDRGEVVQLAQSIACDGPNERALLGVAHDLSHQRAGVGSAAGQHAREEASAPASKAWETLQHRSKVLLVSGLEEASRGDHRDDRGFVVQRPGDRVGIGRHAHAGKHHDRFTAGLRRACLEHRCYARQIGCGHGAHHRLLLSAKAPRVREKKVEEVLPVLVFHSVEDGLRRCRASQYLEDRGLPALVEAQSPSSLGFVREPQEQGENREGE